MVVLPASAACELDPMQHQQCLTARRACSVGALGGALVGNPPDRPAAVIGAVLLVAGIAFGCYGSRPGGGSDRGVLLRTDPQDYRAAVDRVQALG